jgi:hypothetical protein
MSYATLIHQPFQRIAADVRPLTLVREHDVSDRSPFYIVIRSRPADTPSRPRVQTAIAVPPDAPLDRVIAALADAARVALREHPAAMAAAVFAYSDAALLSVGYDGGAAWISRDGGGWTGTGTFPPNTAGSEDRGLIHVVLGDTAAPAARLRLARTYSS